MDTIQPYIRPLTLNVVGSGVKHVTLNIIQQPVDPIAKGSAYLTEYQKEIIAECLNKGSGGLLLPMGSGKTLISILLGLRQGKNYNGGKILVIMAKSLVPTWIDEINKFFGASLKYEIFHGEYIADMDQWVPTAEIIITTPEVLSKIYTIYNVANIFTYTERLDFAPAIKYYRVPENPWLNYPKGKANIFSQKWGAVIVDEAHNYFNITSARCLAIASLSAHHRWLLSGTLFQEPRAEKLMGYYLMLNHPNFPRNLPAFKLYIKDVNYTGLNATVVKRESNENFIPPHINKVIVSHPLSELEGQIYINVKLILNNLRKKLKEFKRTNDSVNIKKFTSYIVGMISHLRQCLVCPIIPITSVALDVADLEEKSELSEIFMNCINEMGINNWLNDINALYSSRIRYVFDKLNDHANKRVIIFSCYRTVLDVINLYIPSNRPRFTISGNHKIEKRNTIINDFRNSPNGILLLTYEIGCNGLNLQFCDTALLVDFWWNAGRSEQAIARILRYGQTSDTVNIYYFTANTGMENALFKMQASKISLAEELATGPMVSKIDKIKIEEILTLIDTEDNVSILDNIISH